MKIIIFALCFLLAGCATTPQPSLLKETSSGIAEATFTARFVEEVKSLIIAGCSEKKMIVHSTSTNEVICGRTMEGLNASLTQYLIGNSYSTTPEVKVSFIISQIGNDVKVYGRPWVETQMAFGQIRKQEIRANEIINKTYQFLQGLGGQ